MLNILIGLVAAVAMFTLDSGAVPSVVAIVLALILAQVRNKKRKEELQQAVAAYAMSYGQPPPGFSTQTTGAGWAIGSVVGDPVIGGLVGAAFDIAKHALGQRAMSEEQKQLHNRISGLSAWSPFLGVYILATWLAMLWGVLALLRD
jgi:hypothetical protein